MPYWPATLVEAIRHFSDPDTCLDFMVTLRWPNGVACPTCGDMEPRFIKTRRLWQCKGKHPKRQFSVKVGTIFEDSPLGLDKWLITMWMIANAKNGVSSYEIHRAIGVTQKTAWFMLHRIRLAMETDGFNDFLRGEVEADETFVGGKAKNMHADRKNFRGRGTVGKAVVMGLLERQGRVQAKVVPDTSTDTLQAEVRRNVYRGSEVFTDAHAAYQGLDDQYIHAFVDHTTMYVMGKVHTNGIENFWSLLKRCIHGTYITVNPAHLFRYVDEQAFRYNNRKTDDGSRFRTAASGAVGKRLTWKQATGKA